MNMKTLVLFKYSVLFLCLCGIHLNGFAQSTREAILEDIARTGGVYYAYPVKEAIATPPPKGYKPFYISHYARHGSRWIQSEQDYKTLYLKSTSVFIFINYIPHSVQIHPGSR